MPTDIFRIGYVPLSDAAPLLVAEAHGLFGRQDVAVQLVPCASWAALRDRIAFGLLDAAQMLSPMPIAAALGLGGVGADLVAGATLGRNGNTIVLGDRLIAEIEAAVPNQAVLRPLPASALAAALARRDEIGAPPISLAVVFPYSSHNYLLRHWLAGGGIDPDRDVRLVVVPPSMVAEQLAAGLIDGFCAGEPWGSRAVDLRVGRIALTTADVWLDHPEKLLVFSRAAAMSGPAVPVIAAVLQAAAWLDQPANHAEAARLLHQKMPAVPSELIAAGLAGRLVFAPDEAPRAIHRPVFFANRSSFPDPAHGAWWLEEMRRWGHVPSDCPDPVPEIWRPKLWQAATDLLSRTADQECPT